MSEMKSKNNTGPSTVPWGIPEITEDGDEIASFEIMYCFLFARKLHSQSPSFEDIPFSFCL